MRAITFTCRATLTQTPDEIASHILDVTQWLDFKGYGPLPGIKSAEVEVFTPEIIGTRIRVTNTDGSRQIEEIVEWQLPHRLQLSMQDFSAPLSLWATRIEETWEFEAVGTETKVSRSFRMLPRNIVAWPILWLISILLKKAIARHLRQLRGQ